MLAFELKKKLEEHNLGKFYDMLLRRKKVKQYLRYINNTNWLGRNIDSKRNMRYFLDKLHQDPTKLINAFYWASSDEGYNYWAICNSEWVFICNQIIKRHDDSMS